MSAWIIHSVFHFRIPCHAHAMVLRVGLSVPILTCLASQEMRSSRCCPRARERRARRGTWFVHGAFFPGGGTTPLQQFPSTTATKLPLPGYGMVRCNADCDKLILPCFSHPTHDAPGKTPVNRGKLSEERSPPRPENRRHQLRGGRIHCKVQPQFIY
ncbi:hypothetical protein GQ53DRAFT_342819 [Thozetella sp. PMI_491]|nr:hypothetical protein GQ53DRAFT_342819 [Thozetella sp. PMI_491]